MQDLDTATLLVVTSVEAAIHSAILEDPTRLEDPAFEQELVALCCRYLGVPEHTTTLSANHRQQPRPHPPYADRGVVWSTLSAGGRAIGVPASTPVHVIGERVAGV